MGWSLPDSGFPGGARSARVASLLRGRVQCGSLRRFRGKRQRNQEAGTRCQRGGRRFAAELRSASARARGATRVGSPDRGHGEVGEGPISPWVSVM